MPGTIRGDYCVQAYRNLCHASDSIKSAKEETAFWFSNEELVKWDPVTSSWLYWDFEATVNPVKNGDSLLDQVFDYNPRG